VRVVSADKATRRRPLELIAVLFESDPDELAPSLDGQLLEQEPQTRFDSTFG